MRAVGGKIVWGEGSRKQQYSIRHSWVLYCHSLDPSPQTIMPPTAQPFMLKLIYCCLCGWSQGTTHFCQKSPLYFAQGRCLLPQRSSQSAWVVQRVLLLILQTLRFWFSKYNNDWVQWVVLNESRLAKFGKKYWQHGRDGVMIVQI